MLSESLRVALNEPTDSHDTMLERLPEGWKEVVAEDIERFRPNGQL